MEPDDLLCSRNARSRTPLVGRAQWKINQPPSLRDNERAWREHLFVRRAQSRINQATLENEIVEGITRAEEGIGSGQTILLARRTRTMKLCSSDARSEGQSGDSLRRESVMLQRRKQGALARANGTSRRASGWAGEKAARSGRSISPHP